MSPISANQNYEIGPVVVFDEIRPVMLARQAERVDQVALFKKAVEKAVAEAEVVGVGGESVAFRLLKVMPRSCV